MFIFEVQQQHYNQHPRPPPHCLYRRLEVPEETLKLLNGMSMGYFEACLKLNYLHGTSPWPSVKFPCQQTFPSNKITRYYFRLSNLLFMLQLVVVLLIFFVMMVLPGRKRVFYTQIVPVFNSDRYSLGLVGLGCVIVLHQ